MAWYDAIFLKYRTIKNELSPLTQRAALAFRGFTVQDDASNDRTLVIIGGGLGTDLTDADATITYAQGTWRVMAASTLSGDRTIRISASGALSGDQITITRYDTSSNALTVVDDSSSATLCKLNLSGGGGALVQSALFEYTGSAWALRLAGAVPPS